MTLAVRNWFFEMRAGSGMMRPECLIYWRIVAHFERKQQKPPGATRGNRQRAKAPAFTKSAGL
jgi:hypothetical protein